LGYCNVYGVVTLPNIKSEKLHSKLGFETVGTLKNVGFKLGKWMDVKYMSLNIKEYTPSPEKPKNIEKLAGTREFELILDRVKSIIE
jgi:phosphinothricin acetyltransferase